MSEKYLDKIWEIMINNHIELDTETSNDILCIICKNILINACSVPCGCRYCSKCIYNYLDGEEKYCLGNNINCKSEFMIINKNIQSDTAINSKISTLVVKCPIRFCDFKDQLKNIGYHITTCSFQTVKCPFFNIGCKEDNVSQNKINDHFKLEDYSHSKLLLEHIDQLSNEIKLIRQTLKHLEIESNTLRMGLKESVLNKSANTTQFDEINENILALKNESGIECQTELEMPDDVHNQLELTNKNIAAMEMDYKLIKQAVNDLQLQNDQLQVEMQNEKAFNSLHSASDIWSHVLAETTAEMEHTNKNWNLKTEAKIKETLSQIEKINQTNANLKVANQLSMNKINKLKIDGDKKQTEINKLNQNFTTIDKKLRVLQEVEVENVKSDGKKMKNAHTELETKLKSIHVELKALVTNFESSKKERNCHIKKTETEKNNLNQLILTLNNKIISYQKEIENFKLEEIRKSNIEMDLKFKVISSQWELIIKDMESLKEENKLLKEDIKLIKANNTFDENSKLDSNEKFKATEIRINKLQDEIQTLRNENMVLKNIINTLKLEQDDVAIKGEELLAHVGAHKRDLEKLEAQFAELRKHPKYNDNQRESFNYKSLPIESHLEKANISCQQISSNPDQPNGLFWCLEDFPEKIEQAENNIQPMIRSRIFYSSRPGYKMRLTLFPGGTGSGKGTHLSVNFNILRDKSDNVLSWPFKYRVTISLINQSTNQPHSSQSSQNDHREFTSRMKPIDWVNPPIRFHELIELHALMNNADLCKGGRLFLECSLQMEG